VTHACNNSFHRGERIPAASSWKLASTLLGAKNLFDLHCHLELAERPVRHQVGEEFCYVAARLWQSESHVLGDGIAVPVRELDWDAAPVFRPPRCVLMVICWPALALKVK